MRTPPAPGTAQLVEGLHELLTSHGHAPIGAGEDFLGATYELLQGEDHVILRHHGPESADHSTDGYRRLIESDNSPAWANATPQDTPDGMVLRVTAAAVE